MSDRVEQYGDFAYYYDILMDDIDYDSWCSYIDSTIKNNKVIYNDVLEMACGTGNVSVKMAQKGYDVTAFDISQDMLAVASKKALDMNLKVNYLVQDMRNININDKYGIILCLCDSVNYITDKEALTGVFKWVHDHLKDGGIFIFDINSSYKLKKIIGNNTFTYDSDDIVYIWDNFLSDDTVEFSLTFFVKQGDLYRRFDEFHMERIYEIHEVIDSLNAAGMTEIKSCDEYSESSVHDESERISFITLKKH